MRILPPDADFWTKVKQWAFGTMWRARMTNLSAQVDEMDVVGVLFMIGDGGMQGVVRFLGICRINNPKARRDASDMGVYRHEWHPIGEHECAGGCFGADARNAYEPFECIVGRHLGQMVNRVASCGVIEIFEEFLDVFGLVARQTGHANDIHKLIKWRVTYVIPAEVTLLQVGKCPAAIGISGALRQNGLYELVESFVALVPGALTKVDVKPTEESLNVCCLSHVACNGMMIVNQYHYSIESIWS